MPEYPSTYMATLWVPSPPPGVSEPSRLPRGRCPSTGFGPRPPRGGGTAPGLARLIRKGSCRSTLQHIETSEKPRIIRKGSCRSTLRHIRRRCGFPPLPLGCQSSSRLPRGRCPSTGFGPRPPRGGGTAPGRARSYPSSPMAGPAQPRSPHGAHDVPAGRVGGF